MLRNQKGFTLIEIIAVLVILGILAAVAIPKYLNMQDDARRRVADGAIAAGLSNTSLGYAKWLLNGSFAELPQTVCANIQADGSETFNMTCTAVGGNTWNGLTSMTVAATYGGQSGNTRNWVKP